AARLDERRGDDGERAAALDVARRAEDLARDLERRGVQAARHGAPAAAPEEVEAAPQAGQRVEQQHHVVPLLDEALGILQRQRRYAYVVVFFAVVRRGKDLASRRPAEVGDLLGPLVDEQGDELDLRVVL